MPILLNKNLNSSCYNTNGVGSNLLKNRITLFCPVQQITQKRYFIFKYSVLFYDFLFGKPRYRKRRRLRKLRKRYLAMRKPDSEKYW